MGVRYLVDSNCIIDFCNGKLTDTGKNFLIGIKPEISIVTNIELFATKNIEESEYLLLKKFVSISTVHPITANLIENTIYIRKNNKIKLPNALIAATALTYNFVLISRNTSDFKNVSGLNTINPHSL